MITKILVDICCSCFSCCDRLDHGRRSGYTITTGINSYHICSSTFICRNTSTIDSHSKISKRPRYNILSDSNQHNIAFHTLFRFIGLTRGRSATFYRSDNLRLYPKCTCISLCICLYTKRSFQSNKFDSLCDCTFHFCRKCCHIFLTSAVNDAYCLRVCTHSCSRAIHSYVSATYDNDTFSGVIRVCSVTNLTQHINSRNHVFAVFPFKSELFICMCTDSHVDCIVLLLNLFQFFCSDRCI